MMDTMQVGRRLVELCSQGKNRQAIEELYADNVDVHEAMDPAAMGPECPAGMRPNGMQTKDDLLAGSDHFFESTEIHDRSTEGPFPNGDEFIVYMRLDSTFKNGPMAGRRMEMKEACVYKVADGKIVSSRFCYDVQGS